jgi:hypothetical protein
LTTTQILNEPYKKGETTLSGPQRAAKDGSFYRFDRRGMKTQISAVQDFKYQKKKKRTVILN